MRVGKYLSRLRLGLTAVLAVAVFAGVMVASAAAQPPSDASGLPANGNVFNPQETNVPYLAWRGEEVRLVKCVGGLTSDAIGESTTQTSGSFIFNRGGFNVSMAIFAYSGPQENSFDGPKAVTDTGNIFFDRGRICVRGTWISNKAGITVIKLTVSHNGVILGQHDFLIGWMAVNSADITNPGTVSEDAGFEPGNSVNVQVTGSIPLNQEFQDDWGLSSQLVMPNDWATWANAMATTDQNLGGTNSLPPSAYWDIHDSSGPLGNEDPDGSPDVHVNQTACPGSTPMTFVDQVDNCIGGVRLVLEDLRRPDQWAVRPVRPELRLDVAERRPVELVRRAHAGAEDRAQQQRWNGRVRRLLPERQVRRLQPQLRSGQPADLHRGGPRQRTRHMPCTRRTHAQYVPATSRDPFGAASGVDGPVYTQFTGQPNNFPGFGWYGRYYNWQIAQNLVQNDEQRHQLSAQVPGLQADLPPDQRLRDAHRRVHRRARRGTGSVAAGCRQRQLRHHCRLRGRQRRL